jgi:hypothetical protein
MLGAGDFVEKSGLQNTIPSKRVSPNAPDNGSLWNPKWLPTTQYKTRIIKNYQIRDFFLQNRSKKNAPPRPGVVIVQKQALWDMFNPVF